MPPRIVVRTAGLLLFLLASAGPVRAANAERPLVVGSIRPLYLIVLALAGDRVDTRQLLDAGSSAHDFALRPSQLRLLGDARQVFWIDPALEHPLLPLLARLPGPRRDTALLPSLGLPPRADGVVDPHVWLDPVLMQQMSTAVADALAEADPANAQTFQDNAAALNEELATLNTDWAQGTANCEIDTLVVSHEAFGYLAAQYGFEQRGISGLTPENEPSAAAIAELAEFVNANGVTTVYTETLVDPAVAETVAAEAGVQTAVLDPLEGPPAEGDYLSAMRDNLETVKAGQNCS